MCLIKSFMCILLIIAIFIGPAIDNGPVIIGDPVLGWCAATVPKKGHCRNRGFVLCNTAMVMVL